ncbi:MAG: sarcosine oxidase subunit gamma [Aestuariivirgaceae bacterium]|nr:sarcosine oxidase subunit gamma [Aestuariivirgaceae bacterium]
MAKSLAIPSRRAPAWTQGRFGADPAGGPGVRLALVHPVSSVLISVSPPKARAVSKALAARFGVELPQASGAAQSKKLRLCWCGPGQFYAVVENAAEGALLKDLQGVLGGLAVLTDQSHSRVTFRLSGAKATALLAKGGTSLDVHPSAFETGSSAMTVLAHVPAQIVHLVEGVYDVSLPRSFTSSFREWLLHQAEGFGLEVV